MTGATLDPFWPLARMLEAGPDHWSPENLRASEPDLARLVSVLT